MVAPPEPHATAILFTTLALLLGVSILFSRASSKTGIPLALVFLIIGMLAGSEGIGGILFDDYTTAFRLGLAALVLILFDGGLNSSGATVRQWARPAGVLATVGVLGTAGVTGVVAHALGLAWTHALLLGAIVSSTDAAVVFAVLRGSGTHLKRRVGQTLEIESGLNDPVAVILTVELTGQLLAPGALSVWRAALAMLLELAVGALVGFAVGYGGRALLARVRLQAGGLYAALTVALALLAFGAPTLLHGSGFLAVYVAGVILGDAPIPNRASVLRVHDTLAWLGQIVMFLVLGLLAFPTRLVSVAWMGLLLALVLAFVARPLVVALCLLPFRYPPREVAYIGWAGLRGAVPIVLAIYPVLAGAPAAERIFDLVFFIVVINALVPGSTVPWVTRWLGLESGEPPPPKAVLEIESTLPLRGDLLSFYIEEALAVTGVPIADLPFPEGAAATLIVRGQELVAPKGTTMLLPGDHVYIFARPEDRPLIQLMFGRPEAD
jgi:cell volume regulation protein A